MQRENRILGGAGGQTAKGEPQMTVVQAWREAAQKTSGEIALRRFH